MRATMNKETFDALDGAALCRACFEPIAERIRRQSPEVKAEVYRSLTEGQKQLMLLLVLIEHAKGSPEELLGWAAYLRKNELETWSMVLSNLVAMGCRELQSLLQQVGGSDEEAELIYNRFLALSNDALDQIARSIRSHPELFIQWEENR